MPAETLTAQLAQAAHALYRQPLPAEVEALQRELLADTLLVAAAGRAQASSQALVAALPQAPGVSRVWFSDAGVAAADAAWINSLHAAALDFDSLNGSVHADLVTLPAAWAVAEEQGATPAQMLRAYALASELVSRLARGSHGPSLGWSGTSIFGGMGAALAAGLLLELSPEVLQHALGLAAVQAAGTQQANVEKTLAKRLQPAFAVRAGVIAAYLARAGASAPAEALEGRFGLRALYQPGDDCQLLDGFGEHWQLLDTQIKAYPVCACGHAAVQALLDLIEAHDIAPAEIVQISAQISPFMQRLVGGDFAVSGDLQVLAQFNLRYQLASAVMRGPLTLAHLEPDAVSDPTLAPLLGCIELKVDEHNSGELAPASVALRLRDGRVLFARCEALPGSKQRPLTDAARRAKACACLAAAGLNPDEQTLAAQLAACLDGPTLSAPWSM